MIETIRAVLQITDRLFGGYLGLVERLVEALAGQFDLKYASILKEPQTPADVRLAKLDQARAALAEVLSALDDLQEEAEARKQESERAFKRLQDTLATQQDAEHKLQSVKALLEQDQNTLRMVSGNTPVARIAVFIAGVLASLIAAGLVWLGGFILGLLGGG